MAVRVSQAEEVVELGVRRPRWAAVRPECAGGTGVRVRGAHGEGGGRGK